MFYVLCVLKNILCFWFTFKKIRFFTVTPAIAERSEEFPSFFLIFFHFSFFLNVVHFFVFFRDFEKKKVVFRFFSLFPFFSFFPSLQAPSLS